MSIRNIYIKGRHHVWFVLLLYLEIKGNHLWQCCHAVTMNILEHICFHYVLLYWHYLWLNIYIEIINFEGRHSLWLNLWHSLSRNKMQSTLTMLSLSHHMKHILYVFPLCSTVLVLNYKLIFGLGYQYCGLSCLINFSVSYC